MIQYFNSKIRAISSGVQKVTMYDYCVVFHKLLLSLLNYYAFISNSHVKGIVNGADFSHHAFGGGALSTSSR